MAELPTKEDLEKLYHEQGLDALVWYIWRNTLRILPMLGCMPLTDVWGTNTRSFVYEICRGVIILPQILHDEYLSEHIMFTSSAAAKSSHYSHIKNVAYAVARAMYVAATDFSEDVIDVAFIINQYVIDDGSIDVKIIGEATRADLSRVRQRKGITWDSTLLWPQSTKPQAIKDWENDFITNLIIDIIYKKLKYIDNNYQWQDAHPERKFLTVIIA